MIDAVVTLHTNPLTCGVARCNQQIAQRLGVPMVPLAALPHVRYTCPLVSLKWAELPPALQMVVPHWSFPAGTRFLWHDAGCPSLRERYPSQFAHEVGIPATVDLLKPTPAHGLRWFSLGMAHKLTVPLYQQAARLEKPGSIWVSAWLHDGTTWDTMLPTLEQLNLIAPTTLLGSLTDAALAWVWPEVDVFVAFFRDGLQANHTSVHAALDAEIPVLTNWGPLTPADLKRRTVDLSHLTAWPTKWPSGPSPYTWERLMEALCGS